MTIVEPLAGLRRGVSEARFTGMGGSVQVIVVGGRPSLVRRAQARIAELERSWSRFDARSELCELNSRAGDVVHVSDDLFLAVSRAVEAWLLTEGSFDPTTLDAVERAGYDRSFDELSGVAVRRRGTPLVGCAGIDLDAGRRTIAVPAGIRLDLGGIGKGLAADVVVTELLDLGADGALVNIGGDLRLAGAAPGADGWIVEIEDPRRPLERGVSVALADGAVVTSSVLEKRWPVAGDVAHHLIDPKTGRPVVTPIATATVVAAEGWWAEAVTKAIFMLGPVDGLAFADRHDVHALLFLADGSHTAAGRWKDILA